MDEQSEETELLLALLSSMVDSPLLSHADLLGALADAGGNVQEAFKLLNESRQPHVSKCQPKRKRTKGLDGWVTNKKRPRAAGSPLASYRQLEQARRMAPPTMRPSSPGFTIEEPIVLESDEGELSEGITDGGDTLVSATHSGINDHNIQSSSVATIQSVNPLMSVLKQAPTAKALPKLLPRTLGTPALVAKYTPCTMHASILSPELACRLFYAMLREAASWSRNKW